MHSPRRYKVAEAAELLEVSPATVYRAIRAGNLTAKRVFGQWRIPAAAVDELLDPQPAAATA